MMKPICPASNIPSILAEAAIHGGALIAAHHVSKSFAGVPVLCDVSVDIFAGQVHTIMGENGAGKSTLLKIFGGVHRPDEGSITLDGKTVHIRSPAAAQRLGISLIHQEPLSFPDLDIAENIYLAGPAKTACTLRRD